MDNNTLADALQDALGAHFTWKTRLRRAVASQSSDVPVATARRDDCCALGKLLYEQLPADRRGGEQYDTARALHRRFHETAADALTHALAGDKAGATDIIEGQFTELSSKLGAVLLKWRAAAMR